jgi:hypothetical protein
MMVDFMLCVENLGYHDENWNARTFSGVVGGNSVGGDTGEGMMAGSRQDQSATKLPRKSRRGNSSIRGAKRQNLMPPNSSCPPRSPPLCLSTATHISYLRAGKGQGMGCGMGLLAGRLSLRRRKMRQV